MKTQQETQVLADIAAAKERGEDPFGDNETEEVEAVEEDLTGNITTPTDEVVIENPAEAVEELPVAATEEAVSDQPTSYKTDMPADYKAQRGELVKEKAQLMKKLMDGEIDADLFASEEARISDSLEDLTAQRVKAETLSEANVQTQAVYQQREIQKLMTRAKADVDYATDVKGQRQFDIAMNALSQDPDNAGKDYAELVGEAHKVVLALRGVVSKGDKVAEAIKSRIPEGKPPVTLRSLPTASTPNANGNMLDQIGRLKGQEYQDAYAKLSPTQKRTLLDME